MPDAAASTASTRSPAARNSDDLPLPDGPDEQDDVAGSDVEVDVFGNDVRRFGVGEAEQVGDGRGGKAAADGADGDNGW